MAVVPELKTALATLQKKVEAAPADPTNTATAANGPSDAARTQRDRNFVDSSKNNDDDANDRREEPDGNPHDDVLEVLRLFLADKAVGRPTILKNQASALKEIRNLTRRSLAAYVAEVVMTRPKVEIDLDDVEDVVNELAGDEAAMKSLLEDVRRRQVADKKNTKTAAANARSTAPKSDKRSLTTTATGSAKSSGATKKQRLTFDNNSRNAQRQPVEPLERGDVEVMVESSDGE